MEDYVRLSDQPRQFTVSDPFTGRTVRVERTDGSTETGTIVDIVRYEAYDHTRVIVELDGGPELNVSSERVTLL